MAHHWLSPSAADRWIICPASAVITYKLGIKSKPSAKALEGTKAHSAAEYWLKNGQPPAWAGKDMVEFVKPYVEHTTTFAKLGTDARIEYKIKLDQFLGEGGSGTADAVIGHVPATHGYMNVISDLKYGAGVEVSAVKNLQLSIYALGIAELTKQRYNEYPSYTMLNIFQPRVKATTPKSYLLTNDELEHVREEVIIAKEEAYRLQELNVDELYKHTKPSKEACQWCPARGVCPNKYESDLSTLLQGE